MLFRSRGMCHHLSTDFKKSNSDFFMYTKMHPLEADGWLLLAESSLYIENYRLTKKAVRHFIKMEPKNSAAYFIEACACFYTNRSNKARKLFVKSILYDPEFTLSNLYLSIGLLKGHSGPDKIDALDSLILNEFTLHPPRNNFEGSIMNWHINHLRTFYQSYLE